MIPPTKQCISSKSTGEGCDDAYICQKVVGLGRYELVIDKQLIQCWSYCVYEQETADVVFPQNEIIGLIHGPVTDMKLLRLKGMKDINDTCSANVGGFIDGTWKELIEKQDKLFKPK